MYLGRPLWRPRDSKFLIKKNLIFFSAVNFSQFYVIKTPESRFSIQPKMLDPDPYEMNSIRNPGSWRILEIKITCLGNYLEIKDVVDILCLFDLPEEGEVLHHELGGRLLAVQVQQVNHALTLPRMGGVSTGLEGGLNVAWTKYQ